MSDHKPGAPVSEGMGAAQKGRDDGKGKSYIRIETKKEALELAKQEGSMAAERLFQQSIRFCSAVESPGCLSGTFYIPSKSMHKSHTGFYFIIKDDTVTFVDDSGLVSRRLGEMEEARRFNATGAGRFFPEFLNFLLEGEAVFLTEVENQLAELEDDILSGVRKNYNHIISSYRRKIMAFSHYYLQLSDMATTLQGDENHFFGKEDERILRLFSERVNRLREEAQLLRDYSIQIREVYQSQIDVHQNEIMKVLTIVTTVFLPLSLIAAWYGMNFKYMPELGWRYGYLAVVAVSLAVVALCVWLFKKKKFW